MERRSRRRAPAALRGGWGGYEETEFCDERRQSDAARRKPFGVDALLRRRSRFVGGAWDGSWRGLLRDASEGCRARALPSARAPSLGAGRTRTVREGASGVGPLERWRTGLVVSDVEGSSPVVGPGLFGGPEGHGRRRGAPRPRTPQASACGSRGRRARPATWAGGAATPRAGRCHPRVASCRGDPEDHEAARRAFVREGTRQDAGQVSASMCGEAGAPRRRASDGFGRSVPARASTCATPSGVVYGAEGTEGSQRPSEEARARTSGPEQPPAAEGRTKRGEPSPAAVSGRRGRRRVAGRRSEELEAAFGR